MIPIGALHTEKIAEAALLYVFIIAFPASLFTTLEKCGQNDIKRGKKEKKYQTIVKSLVDIMDNIKTLKLEKSHENYISSK